MRQKQIMKEHLEKVDTNMNSNSYLKKGIKDRTKRKNGKYSGTTHPTIAQLQHA